MGQHHHEEDGVERDRRNPAGKSGRNFSPLTGWAVLCAVLLTVIAGVWLYTRMLPSEPHSKSPGLKLDVETPGKSAVPMPGT